MDKIQILDELLPQVQKNCLISDARFWGHYSICGLLLRLRELYRFQQNLAPSDAIEQSAISEWIGRTEANWERMKDMPLEPMALRGREFDAFDADRLNAAIREAGLIYGAGYGIYGKPVFFLADLEGTEALGPCTLHVAGREYARDLSLHPAMLQGKTIYARTYVSELLIHEKYEEFVALRGKRGTLQAAFAAYGLQDGATAAELRKVARSELRTYIHHELGEARESDLLGPLWGEMLGAVMGTRESMYLRGVKDVLADTSEAGMLRHIIDEGKEGSLAFYFVFLSGFRKLLSRPLEDAFRAFAETGWQGVEDARAACYRQGREIADGLLATYRRGRSAVSLQGEVQRLITLACPPRSR